MYLSETDPFNLAGEAHVPRRADLVMRTSKSILAEFGTGPDQHNTVTPGYLPILGLCPINLFALYSPHLLDETIPNGALCAVLVRADMAVRTAEALHVHPNSS